ncbi:MAG: hypothetical protein NT172_20645 [Planctomycetota bacterium]|nr:hypothetical protein [Planctomycetota bacterium]
MPTNFKAEKVLANLKILASLCPSPRKDKLRAMDERGLFRISENATGLFGGWGRDMADSITGELGNQIVEFFEFAKPHSYKRPRLIPTVQINPADQFADMGLATNIRSRALGISYKVAGKEDRLLGNVAVKSDFDNALAGLKRMKVSYSRDRLTRLNEIITRVETVMSTFTGGPNINYEQWAGIACEHARSTMIYKSVNKASLTKQYEIRGVSLTAEQKRSKASSKLVAIRDLDVTSTMRGDYAAQEGVGNCGEQSRIAANFLLLNNISPLVMCSLVRPGDHAFVAIGPGVSELHDNSNRDILCGNFNNWPRGIYICDPWANIYCESGSYATKFFNKMHQWRDKGKAIRGFGLHQVKGQNEFFDPAEIATCVDIHNKVLNGWVI